MLFAALQGNRCVVFARRLGTSDEMLETELRLVTSGAFGFRAAGIDLVHAVFDGWYALRAVTEAREAGIPSVLSFHGGFDIHVAIRRPDIASAIRGLAATSTVVTVPSSAARASLACVAPALRVIVLPVPIDPAALPAPSPNRSGAIVVSRLIPKKGIDTALRAVALLNRDASVPFRLQVVGDGPLRSALVETRARLALTAHVEFVGLQPLSSTLTFLSAAEVLVHSGRIASDGNTDGIPQIILWALAMGTPVVACDAGAVNELIRDGYTGLLVAPDDATALATAIKRMVADRRLQAYFIENGRNAVIPHLLPAVIGALNQVHRTAILSQASAQQ